MQHPQKRREAGVRDIPSISAAHDAPFRRLTMLGLAASTANDRAGAFQNFKAAREAAERVFEDASRHGGGAALVAPMMLNVACQNTAVELRHQGDEDGAIEDLAYAVTRLTSAAGSVDVPLAMRLNCARHLRHSMKALVTVAHHVDDRLLAEVTDVVGRVIRVAEASFYCGVKSAARH